MRDEVMRGNHARMWGLREWTHVLYMSKCEARSFKALSAPASGTTTRSRSSKSAHFGVDAYERGDGCSERRDGDDN